jgi:ABC-type bacteriocin/lantibiotic exporter with double-glycine peptidase domain
MVSKKIALILIVSLSSVTALLAAYHDNSVTSEGVMCGPTSLYALCRHLYPNIRRKDVFRPFGESTELADANFTEIKQAARALGFTAQGVKMNMLELRQLKPAGILYVDNIHFVALYGFFADGICVANPNGIAKYQDELWPYRYLSDHWDGRILIISPTKNHFPVAHKNNATGYILPE